MAVLTPGRLTTPSHESEIGGAKRRRPPKPPTPSFHNIPTDLKVLRRWLPWRYSNRPNRAGKYGKVPYNVADKKTNYTNPNTWLDFDAAVRQYERGDYDGIGLVLGDELCGLDEDHCVRDCVIDPVAARHIEHLNSYAEYSVSDGVHCLAFGTLPPDGRKRDDHEMYCGARFFVVTGRRVPGTPGAVEKREKELHEVHAMIFGSGGFGTPPEAFGTPTPSVRKPSPNTQREREEGESQTAFKISDEKVIEMVRRDPAAATYLLGCPSGVNPSDADFAFACKLAFYSGRNSEQIERLFRASALGQRPKANSSRGELDYVTYTLRRACREQKAVWKPKETRTASEPARRGGRPRCKVDPERVVQLRDSGSSWRQIQVALGIGTATAMNLYRRGPTRQNAVSRVPKPSQNSADSQSDAGSQPRPTESQDGGIPWAEWKAAALNRIFLEQGVTGQPGRITAATIRLAEGG